MTYVSIKNAIRDAIKDTIKDTSLCVFFSLLFFASLISIPYS